MASSIDEMVIKWSMDSTEFNEGLSKMNRSMGLLKSEFSATSTHLKNFGSAADQLKNKQTYLTKAIELQKGKVDALRKSYEETKAKTGESSKETENAAKKVNQAVAYYEKLKGELKETTTELEKQNSKWLALSKGCESASQKLESASKKLGNIGKDLTAKVTAPIVATGTAAVKLASDLNESINKVDVVFGNNSQQIQDWAKTTIDSCGLSEGSALDAISSFGDMATSMGLTQDAAASMGEELVQRAGDLASFKNISMETAQNALTGIFTGETKSLKNLGVVMTETNLKQYAMANGYKKSYDKMSEAEKVQLRYNYVMDKTKNSMGDFKNTSDGTANSLRTFKESLKQLGETFGQNILPIITPFIQKLTEMSKTFAQMPQEQQQIILKLLALAAALGPTLSILAKAMTVGSGLAKVFGKISGAVGNAGGMINLLSSPIGRAILIIGALVAAGVLLYQNWDAIKEGAQELGQEISEVWEETKQNTIDTWNSIKSSISGAIDTATSFVGEKVDAIYNFFANLHIPEIKIPPIKLPHFSIQGEWSLNPPSTPYLDVDWYSSGAIFKQPTILGGIGVGDAYKGRGANAEAIVPLDEMYRNIEGMIQKDRQVCVYLNVENRIDGKDVVSVMMPRIENNLSKNSKAYKLVKGNI